MKLSVRGIPTDEVDRMRQGGPDANGQPALIRAAEGFANPCRHCLGLIAEGDRKLVLAYRPFTALQPYAETGPIQMSSDGSVILTHQAERPGDQHRVADHDVGPGEFRAEQEFLVREVPLQDIECGLGPSRVVRQGIRDALAVLLEARMPGDVPQPGEGRRVFWANGFGAGGSSGATRSW